MCVKWVQPGSVVVGSATTVSFRTFVPISGRGDSFTLTPYAFPDYPFDVQVLSPDGGAQGLEMTPSSGDDQLWVGSLAPDQTGPWTLTIANFDGGDTCYTDAVLMVEEKTSGVTLTFVTVGTAAILLGLAVWLATRRSRSRDAVDVSD
jgi:hypothetical protein